MICDFSSLEKTVAAQDPTGAEAVLMPEAGIAAVQDITVLPLDQNGRFSERAFKRLKNGISAFAITVEFPIHPQHSQLITHNKESWKTLDCQFPH